MSMSRWIAVTDLDSKHFHIFCNAIVYSDGGKHLGSVTNR